MSFSRRVLIVDNSPIFLNILKEAIIAECNFMPEVFTAASHREACKHLEESKDWLAVISGYELADAPQGEFIANTLKFNIPTIVLTSSLNASDREKALSLNIVDYFPKDINCFEDVAHLINQLKDNHRHKILIVDDSPAFCSFAERLLLNQNYQVVVCNSSESALKILRCTPDINLTLIDYILPDMDGSKLIPQIRKLRNADKLPIIAVSAFNEKNIAARMIKAGASDFLLKPINHEELLMRIRNSLKLVNQIRLSEKARKEAEIANQAKSQLLSRISHELRTPLNAILGFSQLLKGDGNLDSDQTDALHEINHASHHLLHMINEVLDLSQIETGQVKLHPGSVNVACLIHETASMFSTIAGQKNVTLELPERSEASEDMITTDPQRLKQILINLINNGIKYNRPDGRLLISTTTDEQSITIRVKDTGLGIPKDKADMLFQPFSRLHERTHDIEGSGLGLAICKNLVELLKGELKVNSTEGVGSTFSITLPKELDFKTPQPEYFI
ncbi:hybrid sensor histidine kinase/response regulator [Oceanospirillum sanctuarii]|uniref:hybrid sensor histidine kinase/response regulator n=1 Tax=Oceanospirillum sanctuarii TaxID=1434821 RepID=UPI000A3BC97A|nr:response regulator [Oceanospirillum sanctuarii]